MVYIARERELIIKQLISLILKRGFFLLKLWLFDRMPLHSTELNKMPTGEQV